MIEDFFTLKTIGDDNYLYFKGANVEVDSFYKGQKIWENRIRNGLSNGVYRKFEKGVKIQEGRYIDDKKEGKWLEWYDNGEFYSEENYLNGKINGTLKRYYFNETLALEANYLNGKKNGDFVKYYDQEHLPPHGPENRSSQGRYINDEEEGYWKYWYINGVVKKEGSYVNGYPEGEWIERYENGEIKKITSYHTL